MRAEDILDIIEGYIGEGFGTATEEVLGNKNDNIREHTKKRSSYSA